MSKAKKTKLTPQQRLFVREYLKDWNATQAAIRAGYSEKTAQEQSSRLLSKVMVQEAVRAAMEKREEKVEMNAQRVLEQYIRFAFFDVRRLFDTTGELRPMSEWPDDAAAAVNGIDVIELDGDLSGRVKKLKLVDKRAALADIGKHLGMFKEQIELSGKIDLIKAIEEGLERVRSKS
jgi:phage terminase small subunit